MKNEPTNTSEKENSTVWNKKAALKRLRGKEDRLQKVVQVFIDHANAQWQALEAALDTNDLDKIIMEAHTIKGNAANLSGQELQMKAGVFEGAAKTGDQDKLQTLLPEFKKAYEIFCETLETYSSDSKSN